MELWGGLIESWLRHVETVSRLELRDILLSTLKAIRDSLRLLFELLSCGQSSLLCSVLLRLNFCDFWSTALLLGDLTTFMIIFESQLGFPLDPELLTGSCSIFTAAWGIISKKENYCYFTFLLNRKKINKPIGTSCFKAAGYVACWTLLILLTKPVSFLTWVKLQ